MPEAQLYKTETQRTRGEIADALVEMADQIGTGTVRLSEGQQEQQVSLPADPRLEVELERLTDSETGEQRYELEFELRWTA
jgi:amphi-Trp domain-containing protein